MRALRWLGHLLLDMIKWSVTISVVGLWHGFWLCIGWDTAQRLRLVELLQPWLKEVLGG